MDADTSTTDAVEPVTAPDADAPAPGSADAETARGTGTCPCGSGAARAACCQPIIDGDTDAESPEALMRSRYTAFAIGAIDWLVDSQHPDTRDTVDRDSIERWSRGSDWLGLEIHDTEDGGPGDEGGVVEFTARYRQEGTVVEHHERSWFARHEGAWRFHSVLVDDDGPELVPVTPASTVGRNDPCPCGSGKKYKRCCA